MKWFKHSCTARDDQKVSMLMDELGLEGYGCYMIILEVVGHEMGAKNDCFANFSLKKWGSFTQLSAKRFQKFAEVMAELSLFHVEILEKNCKIEIPNLLKYRDNHTKNLQVTNKKVSLDKEKDKDKDKDKDSSNKLELGVRKRNPKTLEDSKNKSSETKKFNLEFEEMWSYLSSIPSNKNFDTAKAQYACCRRAGFELEDIKRYYWDVHCKNASDKKYIKQFKMAVTLGNLKAWKKIKTQDIILEQEQPKKDGWDRLLDKIDNLPDDSFGDN